MAAIQGWGERWKTEVNFKELGGVFRIEGRSAKKEYSKAEPQGKHFK